MSKSKEELKEEAVADFKKMYDADTHPEGDRQFIHKWFEKRIPYWIDQAHAAGRNAERGELREWVDKSETTQEAVKRLEGDELVAYCQALTDIKNHLTE